MRFVKANLADLGKFYRRTKLQALLEDFKASGLECAKLEDWNYTSANGGAQTIRNAIKRYKMVGVDCFSRNNDIYLVRVDV